MKFEKILMIGYSPENLKDEDWARIDSISKSKVLLPKDSLEISKQLIDTDCVLVKLGATVDKNIIDRAPKLKYIGMFGTGFGRIDAKYAASKGITVCNISGYSTEGVAEFVFAILLEHLRDIARGLDQAKKGNYSEDTFFNVSEIKGKTLGIVGLGRIGRRVAELGLGFGASVKYWSRKRKRNIEKIGAQYQELESLLASSDFVSLHLEYNPETKGIINRGRINAIKSGAVFINLAAMELVDITALESRLAKGDITFILDHSDELTKEQADNLSKYKNCIMYPPIAYTTKEATIAKQRMFIDNLESFLKGKPMNKVN